MTEHQKRILTDMINMIEKYLNNKVRLSGCVAALEGMLDAAEIKDKSVIDTWY